MRSLLRSHAAALAGGGLTAGADALAASCTAALGHLQQLRTLLAWGSRGGDGGGLLGSACGQLQQQRCKHSVRMVLLRDHEHLGQQGDLVTVRAGYARHTLFPNGQADYAVPMVLRELQAQGRLSAKALQQLQSRSAKAAAEEQADPATLPPEQQLPRIMEVLSTQTVVASRAFSWRAPEQPREPLTPAQLSAYVAQQMHIALPPQLIMMGERITQYGSYKVPLNLRDSAGQQVELSVLVRKTHQGSKLRRLKASSRGGVRAARQPGTGAASASEQPQAQPTA